MTAGEAGRRGRGLEALLFAAFLLLYLAIGLAFSPGRVFGRADLAFGADVPRVIADLTRYDANHYRTKVHPLFVILLNPVGLALKELIGFPRVAAILMNSAFGAFAVALFRRLLVRLEVRDPFAILWTALFGLSASQIFFGSIPETYASSGASLLLLFVLFAGGAASGLRFVAVSVFSFGMNIANLAVSLTLRALALEWADRREALRRLGRHALGVALFAGILSGVQEWYYPRARVFFGPAALEEERTYLFAPRTLGEAASRAADLFANAFLFNMAAPEIAVEKEGHRYPVAAFRAPGPGALRPSGLAHASLWLVALGFASASLARRRLDREATARALLACLGLNLALYSIYGESLFLYSCHWTFLVVALAALAVERSARESPSRRRTALAWLAALLALQAVTNASFLYEAYSIYR